MSWLCGGGGPGWSLGCAAFGENWGLRTFGLIRRLGRFTGLNFWNLDRNARGRLVRRALLALRGRRRSLLGCLFISRIVIENFAEKLGWSRIPGCALSSYIT